MTPLSARHSQAISALIGAIDQTIHTSLAMNLSSVEDSSGNHGISSPRKATCSSGLNGGITRDLEAASSYSRRMSKHGTVDFKGKRVEIKCNDCGMTRFANIQGFINHCRIKHNQKYTNHDEAVAECGQIIDNTTSREEPVKEVRPIQSVPYLEKLVETRRGPDALQELKKLLEEFVGNKAIYQT